MRSRAALLIFENDHVAVIKRVFENKTYYVFPGGGIEANESPKEAAQREAMEELGVQVDVGACVFQSEDKIQEYYFTATITGGKFGAGTGEEFTDPDRGRGSYEPVWLPLHGLHAIPLYPKAIAAEILKNHKLRDLRNKIE